MFGHLHVHDEYSLLDGFGSADKFVERAKEIKSGFLALTNHGNIDGTIKFQKACLDNDIKPILGCELYIVDDLTVKEKGEKRGHILALAKNHTGWNNLTKMLTIANIEGFYYRPRIDFDSFLKHQEGLVVSTACVGSFIYSEKGLDFLKELIKVNKDVYCELMPLQLDLQKDHNKKILEISKELNLPVVAANDCHYPRKKDAAYQDALLAIQYKDKMSNPDRRKFDSDDYFMKSKEEMISSFRKNHPYIDKKIVESAIFNTKKIADKCNFKLEKSAVYLPNVSEEEDQLKLFKKQCKEGLNRKIIEKDIPSSEYRKRLKYETKIIEQQSFVEYFLIISDIVKWCKQNNILVGPGRGSSGGSLVAYLLDITEVDPIKHKLIFERFISPDREDLPDIDVDFPDKKREEVREYIESKYGKYNVANVSTFLKMKSSMVFRDICRVYEIPKKIEEPLANIINGRKEVNPIYGDMQKRTEYTNSISNFLDETKEGSNFEKEYHEAAGACRNLEGQTRGIGKHAAAIIVTKENLYESDRCNLCIRNKVLTINWEKHDAEYMGMLKLDILGLSNLSVMQKCKDLIKKNHNKEIDFIKDVDLTDEKVLEKFREGKCIGVFQFGTYGLRKLCKDLQIDSFELLMHATAVYRPASLRTGVTQNFIDRRRGKKYEVESPYIDEFLKETKGIIIYQEQVMRIAVELGGLSFTEADKIRKYLDKEDSENLRKYKHSFIKGCMKNGIKRTEAIKIWNILQKHANYGFNKSHACAYTILSFWNQWVKTYYPTEFFCASLTYMSEEKKEELIQEAFDMGLQIITPKIGKSHSTEWAAYKNSIYMPFIEVKGIGNVYAEKLSNLEVKNEGFFVEEKEIKGKLLNILNEIGAYDYEKNYTKCDLIPYRL